MIRISYLLLSLFFYRQFNNFLSSNITDKADHLKIMHIFNFILSNSINTLYKNTLLTNEYFNQFSLLVNSGYFFNILAYIFLFRPYKKKKYIKEIIYHTSNMICLYFITNNSEIIYVLNLTSTFYMMLYFKNTLYQFSIVYFNYTTKNYLINYNLFSTIYLLLFFKIRILDWSIIILSNFRYNTESLILSINLINTINYLIYTQD